MSFFPLDRNIFSSSVWLTGTSDERVLWVWLLCHKDDKGVVRHREIAISDGAKLPRDVVAAALLKFTQPDPDSRTRDHDGARISWTEDGFVRILNHEIYYSKDYSTPRWRRWNARKNENETFAPTVINEGQGQGQLNNDTTDSAAGAAPAPVVAKKRGRPGTAGTVDQRAALDKCSAILGRPLGYSKSNVDALRRAERHYTGDQVRDVLRSIRAGTTPTGRWCQERLRDGLPLAYMLRPGENGAADKILEQLAQGMTPRAAQLAPSNDPASRGGDELPERRADASVTWVDEHGGTDAVALDLLAWLERHSPDALAPAASAVAVHAARERWAGSVGAPNGVLALISQVFYYLTRTGKP